MSTRLACQTDLQSSLIYVGELFPTGRAALFAVVQQTQQPFMIVLLQLKCQHFFLTYHVREISESSESLTYILQSGQV
jgi:hypothetical protein